MSMYLIVDSSPFGRTLKNKLDKNKPNKNKYYFINSSSKNVTEIVKEISSNIPSILFLNADSVTKNVNENILDIILWLRCKYNFKFPIVIYSIYPLERILHKDPKNYFILSPGCVFKEDIDLLNSLGDIIKLKSSSDLKGIIPFLKPRVDDLLKLYKHQMANYDGMALMLEVAKLVYKIDHDNGVLKGTLGIYDEFNSFKDELGHSLLSAYFGFEKFTINETKKKALIGECTKNILLVDDLADKGWLPIISQMLYGKPDANDTIKSLKLQYKEDTPKPIVDLESTKSELQKGIKSHKPHLILLDLRLNNESGKIDPKNLDGYKLLTFLKSDPALKGLPVIMFTGSSNAETIKTLLNAGAEAVWTKPGIDEGLDSNGVIERYEELLILTKKVFSDIESSDFSSLNKGKLVTEFEETRNTLLAATSYIKYRCGLRDWEKENHFFNGFTDIIIDTNFFLTGDKGRDRPIDYATTIFNLYKLVHICTPVSHSINLEENPIKLPRVIVLNSVWKELTEKSRIVDDNDPNLWKRALLSLSIFRPLFGEKIRCEFNRRKKGGEFVTISDFSTNYSNFKYADPDIIDFILHLISGNPIRIWNGESLKYSTDNINVLLLTDESKGVPGHIPNLIKYGHHLLNNPPGKYDILNITDFNNKIKNIQL